MPPMPQQPKPISETVMPVRPRTRVRMARDHSAQGRVSLGPMIRVPCPDPLGSIELLGQQAAHHEMRPGHGTEGEKEPGALAYLIGEAVGAADDEGNGGRALVAPLRQAPGEDLG